MEYSESQIINKLQKLKLEVSSAQDYNKLEKSAKKLEKITQAVANQTDKKMRKQLRKMTEVCQGLIKQKTKYFKKKVLQQLNVSAAKEKSESKQKSLKYCKSVEAFPIKTGILLKKKNVNRDEEQFWGDKTEVQARNKPRIEELVETLKDEVASYKRRITVLQSTTNSVPQRMNQKQISFEHEIGLKLKQKALQIEQLKAKLRYHQQINQQLRNRLLNQQKRQEDYIDNLKSHINKLSQQIQKFHKDNKKLHDDLVRQLQMNSSLKIQIQRLIELSDVLQREKRQRQQSQILKMKDSGIRRQLETLSQQQRFMREMQHIVNTQKQQKILLKQEVDRLNKKILSQQEQLRLYEKQKQKLLQLLQIKGEQLSELKKQFSSLIQLNKQRQEQIAVMGEQLRQCQLGLQRERQRKSSELARKAQYLKRVKQLLN